MRSGVRERARHSCVKTRNSSEEGRLARPFRHIIIFVVESLDTPAGREFPHDPETGSRERLLFAGERLFAAHGFSGVSVRDIANAAGVNSALVGYYFGGKEGLLSEVYRRHCEPMSRERARLLNEALAGRTKPALEKILEAFIRPALLLTQDGEGGRAFIRLRALLSGENSALLDHLVADNFDESTRIFVDALCTVLPKLTRDDVLWRFHFLLGAIYYTATGPQRIFSVSGGRCNPLDVDVTIRQMVAFTSAGFRSPRVVPSRMAAKTPGRGKSVRSE
jgi:AcrR family transcriptional regulator